MCLLSQKHFQSLGAIYKVPYAFGSSENNYSKTYQTDFWSTSTQSAFEESGDLTNCWTPYQWPISVSRLVLKTQIVALSD